MGRTNQNWIRGIRLLMVPAFGSLFAFACVQPQQATTETNTGAVNNGTYQGGLPSTSYDPNVNNYSAQPSYSNPFSVDTSGGGVTNNFPSATNTITPSSLPTGNCLFNVAEAEAAIISYTNQHRQRNGITTAYAGNQNLANMARDWSGQMARAGRLEHRRNLTSFLDQFGLNSIGENIAFFGGQPNVTADRIAYHFVFESWATSPPHNEAMLSRSFTTLGTGVYCQGDEIYATQNFGLSR